MKKIKYISLILAVIIVGSCHKLDVPPLSIISESQVFSTANGVQAYLANMYTFLPIEDFVYEPDKGFLTGDGGRWQNFYQMDAIDGEMAARGGATLRLPSP